MCTQVLVAQTAVYSEPMRQVIDMNTYMFLTLAASKTKREGGGTNIAKHYVIHFLRVSVETNMQLYI